MKTYVIVIIIIIIVVVVVIIHSCDEVDTGVEHYEHEAHVADGVEGAACPGSPVLWNIFCEDQH